MIYKIDKYVKMHTLLLMYAYSKNNVIGESIDRRSLRRLLEEIEPEEIGDGIEYIEKMVEQFTSMFKPYPTSAKLIAEIKKFITGMPDPAEVEDIMVKTAGTAFADDSDINKLKQKSKEVTTKTDNVVRAMDSVRMGIVKVTQGLAPYMANDPELAKIPITTLFEEERLPIPKEKFEAGVEKSFAPSGEYETAFQRGMKAAQTSTEGDGKTPLGKLFSTIAKFFVGFKGGKSSIDQFPTVFDGFLEFLKGVNYEQLKEISGKMSAEGGKLVIKAAQEAGETGSAAAAAAGGAKIEGGGESEGKTDKDATPPEKVDDNLKNSLKRAASQESEPLDAILKGLDDWKDSLSKTSQQALTSGGKFDELKDNIKSELEKVKEARKKSITSIITNVVKSWTSKHEDALVKSKKFAKKSLEALNNLIPQLAAHMEKKSEPKKTSTGKKAASSKAKTSRSRTKKATSESAVRQIDQILLELLQFGRYQMKKMRETDLKDKHGNIIISSGLKVRHKKSQFEYTVDSIVKDKDGKITVMLKSPEEPRFASEPQEKKTLIDKRSSPIIYEADPIQDFSSEYYEPDDESEDDLIAVPAKEFEKEYEVK